VLLPVLALAGGRGVKSSRATAKSRTPRSVPVVPVEPDPDYLTRGTLDEHVHVRRGDTLAAILTARGVSTRDATQWTGAAATVHDARQLQPRRGVTLRFDRATHSLLSISYEIDDRTLLVVRRVEGGIRAERSALPYFTEVKGLAGRIEQGFREDATGAGVPASVVSELAEVFGWEVDLDTGLRPGDEFRLLYENTWQTGEPRPEPGKVLGAQLATRRGPITAVYFEDQDGHGGYYRPNGEPLTRAFLRYPVEFTEISSEFSLLRQHPILHRSRPHLGVDFAAPKGTPVRTVANGTVVEAGWTSGLGVTVRVDHGGNLTSLYGHLSALASGMRQGEVVERGQVIGYVGSSGLSTGPHLHFAMDRDGVYVDPLALTAAAAPSEHIAEPARPAFERMRAAVTRQLANLPASERPVTVSLVDAADRRPE